MINKLSKNIVSEIIQTETITELYPVEFSRHKLSKSVRSGLAGWDDLGWVWAGRVIV